MTGTDHHAGAPARPGQETPPATVGVADVIPIAANLDPAGLTWRTPTYTTGDHPDSLQIATVPGGGLAIRNGRHPDAAMVTCSQRAWTALARALMVGEHLARL